MQWFPHLNFKFDFQVLNNCITYCTSIVDDIIDKTFRKQNITLKLCIILFKSSRCLIFNFAVFQSMSSLFLATPFQCVFALQGYEDSNFFYLHARTTQLGFHALNGQSNSLCFAIFIVIFFLLPFNFLTNVVESKCMSSLEQLYLDNIQNVWVMLTSQIQIPNSHPIYILQ